MRILGRLLLASVVAGVGLAIGAALLVPQAAAFLGANDAQADRLAELEPLSQRSVVYARDGSVLAVLHAEENRLPVPLERVPDHVVQAIVDVEDERFWAHGGVDVRSTLRALYTNVQAGGVEQGGSTITQQLVKNSLLTAKRDAGRKVKEAVLAVRLENKFSKQEILERYLNTVYFGNGAYGVQAAAERYFGLDVGQLHSGQAALLAGMIRNPVGYDPFKFPERARQRRSFALRRMVTMGHLSADERSRFDAEPLPERLVDLLPKPDDYFVEEVKQRLLDDKRLGETEADRYNAVFKGGLQIHTTLDPGYQRIAEEKVATILPDTKGRFTASLVAVEPESGAVRALVGGPGFEQAKYNLATQGHRQAGSAFKPFTLVAALEAGHNPNDTISGSSPCTLPNPGGTPDPWTPGNYEGSKGRTTTLAGQMANSVNCAYARLALIVGVDKVADTAQRMGIVTPLEPTPAMSLGGLRNGVSPLEMASAYATLAADGIHHEPYFIDRVETSEGKAVLATEPDGERAISSQVARLTVGVLEDVIRKGTGTRARLAGRPAAGKTGTAQDYQDAWFVGFTPQLAAAVWMGSPVAEEPMRNVGGIRVTGGSYPARIWGAFMNEALRDAPVIDFPEASTKGLRKATYLRLKTEKNVRDDTSERRRTRPRSTTPRRTTPTTVGAAPVTAPSPQDGPPASTPGEGRPSG